MRKIKRVLAILFTLCTLLSFSLVGCSCPGIGVRLYSDGYYIYSVTYDEPYEAVILGLTNLGIEQEILVIPQEINGYPVKMIGADCKEKVDKKYGEGHYMFNSVNLKRIYVPFEINIANILEEDFFGSDTNIEAFVIMKLKHYNIRGRYIRHNIVDYKGRPEGRWVGSVLDKRGVLKSRIPANVTYYLNLGQETDSVYWVDDYDGEKIRYIPPDPTREGFEFAGWFKERECVNKWDFENDIVPSKNIVIGDTKDHCEYIYHETKLYAKWIPV